MVESNLVSAGLGVFGGLTLSPTGAALVDKISDAVGWLAAPAQEVRMARARATANMILAQSDMEIADLQAASLIERADFRIAVERVVQQMNIETIITKGVTYPTIVGGQLARLRVPDPVEGFFDFIIEQWDSLCQSRPVLTSADLSIG